MDRSVAQAGWLYPFDQSRNADAKGPFFMSRQQ